MTKKEKLQAGIITTDNSEGLPKEREKCQELLVQFNQAKNFAEAKAIGQQLFQNPHLNATIRPPFSCCYGYNIHFEGNAYVNINCTFADDGPITIGKGVLIGPNVTIVTVNHPISPRYRGHIYTRPVVLKSKAWIGAGAVILPGVTIGENSVIGAGSVVTKDIPPNVIAVGNPCRVLREISPEDNIYYDKTHNIKDDLAK